MAVKKRCEACAEVELNGQRNRHIHLETLLYQLRADVVEERCRYQWSQNQLAKRAQISRSTLGAFERGDTISFRNFVKITRALNMGAAWGAFHYYAQNNEETKNRQLSSSIIQSRPTRSKQAQAPYNPFF